MKSNSSTYNQLAKSSGVQRPTLMLGFIRFLFHESKNVQTDQIRTDSVFADFSVLAELLFYAFRQIDFNDYAFVFEGLLSDIKTELLNKTLSPGDLRVARNMGVTLIDLTEILSKENMDMRAPGMQGPLYAISKNLKSSFDYLNGQPGELTIKGLRSFEFEVKRELHALESVRLQLNQAGDAALQPTSGSSESDLSLVFFALLETYYEQHGRADSIATDPSGKTYISFAKFNGSAQLPSNTSLQFEGHPDLIGKLERTADPSVVDVASVSRLGKKESTGIKTVSNDLDWTFQTPIFGLQAPNRGWKITLRNKSEAFDKALNALISQAENREEGLTNIRTSLNEVLEMSYETSTGQHFVIPASQANTEVSITDAEAQIELSAFLSFGDPYTSPVNPVVHVKIANADDTLLELLDHFECETVEFGSSALDLSDFSLFNDAGAIFPGDAILPFGSIPGNGAAFTLGHPVVFCNRLASLKLNFQWLNLPDDYRGMESYYQAYPQIQDHEDFKVIASVKNGSGRYPDSDRPVVNLFETVPDESGMSKVLSPISRLSPFEVDFKLPNYTGFNPFEQESESRQGFLRLELAGPEGAFGHTRFHSLYADYMRQNGQGIQSPPNKPYTPELTRVSADVELLDSTALNGTFRAGGSRAGSINLKPSENRLVFPELAESFLSIELNGSQNQTADLFLAVDKAVTGTNELKQRDLFFAMNGQLTKVDPSSILFDETHGFNDTGIFSVKLPTAERDYDRIHLVLTSQQARAFDCFSMVAGRAIQLELSGTRNIPVKGQKMLFKGIPGSNDVTLLSSPVSTELTADYISQKGAFTHGLIAGAKDLEEQVLSAFPGLKSAKALGTADTKKSMRLACLPHFVHSGDEHISFGSPVLSEGFRAKISAYITERLPESSKPVDVTGFDLFPLSLEVSYSSRYKHALDEGDRMMNGIICGFLNDHSGLTDLHDTDIPDLVELQARLERCEACEAIHYIKPVKLPVGAFCQGNRIEVEDKALRFIPGDNHVVLRSATPPIQQKLGGPGIGRIGETFIVDSEVQTKPETNDSDTSGTSPIKVTG